MWDTDGYGDTALQIPRPAAAAITEFDAAASGLQNAIGSAWPGHEGGHPEILKLGS